MRNQAHNNLANRGAHAFVSTRTCALTQIAPVMHIDTNAPVMEPALLEAKKDKQARGRLSSPSKLMSI